MGGGRLHGRWPSPWAAAVSMGGGSLQGGGWGSLMAGPVSWTVAVYRAVGGVV